MDTETFILSVRERSAVWDQQQSSHHNRFILDRMWKEIGQENNCTGTRNSFIRTQTKH